MPIFDTHAHYDADRFGSDRDEVLAALPGDGVGLVMDPGCDLPSSRAAVALAEKYSHVYAAVGIHPEDCAGFQDGDLAELRQLLRHPKVVAVGEIESDVSRFDVNPCCAAGAAKAVRARLVDGDGGVGAFARDVDRGYSVIGKSGRCDKGESQGAERSERERARKMVAQGVKHAG